VALSDEEQRVLAEIEHALAAEDPYLAHAIECGRPRSRVLTVVPAVGLLCGIVLVVIGLLGVDAVHVATAVLGFMIIVVACLAGVTTYRRRHGGPSGGRW
jgi:hypothetical protein